MYRACEDMHSFPGPKLLQQIKFSNLTAADTEIRWGSERYAQKILTLDHNKLRKKIR